jgi:hypothetical protein
MRANALVPAKTFGIRRVPRRADASGTLDA